MSKDEITTGGVHHFRLKVTDVERSVDWYTRLLGFEVAADMGDQVALNNGSVLLMVTPKPRPVPPDPDPGPTSKSGPGVDHLSFGLESRKALENAAAVLKKNDVPHGEIVDLGPDLGIYVLEFRDPDDVHLELSAPHEDVV